MFAVIKGEHITGTQALAARLGIAPRVARRMKERLREKGFLSIADGPVGGVPGPSGPIGSDTRRIRLHALQVEVVVIGGQVLSSRVIPDFMGCRIVVHPRKVEIYGREGVAFYGQDEGEAQEAALEFLDRLGRRLEHDLNCILIKPRAQNWCIVKAEWATEGSEVARRHIVERVKLEVVDTKTGKVWLWGDWSKREPEHETRDKGLSEVVNHRINDWKDNNPPTDTQLYTLIGHMMRYETQQAQHLRDVTAVVALLVKKLTPPEEPKEERDVGVPFYVG